MYDFYHPKLIASCTSFFFGTIFIRFLTRLLEKLPLKINQKIINNNNNNKEKALLHHVLLKKAFKRIFFFYFMIYLQIYTNSVGKLENLLKSKKKISLNRFEIY